MMPDLAFPNSAELDPVVTDASSNALVPMRQLGARGADEGIAAVAGLGGHAVDVGRVLVLTAAANREPAVGILDHARLELEHLVEVVHRQRFGEGAVHPLLGGDLVAGDQRLGLTHDGDLLDLHRGRSSWMSTVPVWPASTFTPSTWVDLYPMKAARTDDRAEAGTLLMK